MGFFGDPSKGWSFMKAAFSMAVQNPSFWHRRTHILATIVYFVVWVSRSARSIPRMVQRPVLRQPVFTFGAFLIFFSLRQT